MALAVIIASVPITVYAQETTIHLGVFSDVHFYADELKGNNCEAYQEFTVAKSKEYAENYSLVNNALEGILKNAENDGADYLLIPGDMTKDGELESHKALAKILEQWQAETGIPVFVTNGNHDVNNSDACTFVNGKKEQAEKTTPEQFREVYKNLGWDKADATFTPAGYSEDYDGIKGGMLSYAANLGDAYRLIVVDTNKYSVDNGAEKTEHVTGGRVDDELLAWVTAQAEQAEKEGRIPLVMQHHNLVPHMDTEPGTFFAFVCDDWEKVADAYGDAGIHYVFTGHLHTSDTSSYINDNGEEVTDILSPTLTGYPNYFRTIDVTTDGSNITFDMVSHDIDEYSPVVSENGKVYAAPYKYTASFDQTFGNNIEDFLERTLGDVVNNYFTQIQEAGSLITFLTYMGVDVQQILIDLLGTDGLAIGNYNILTISGNVMGFINDLDRQIMEVYVNNPQETLDKVMALVHKLLSIEISDYPCTYNAQVLGSKYYTGKPCTLSEYATSALLLYYEGDEDLYGKAGYEYLADALDKFESGENTEKFFNLLVEVLVDDLVQGEILSNLYFNLDTLFPSGAAFWLTGKLFSTIIDKLLVGNNSYMNLIDSVLGLSVVPEGYNSVNDILDTLLLNKYFTKSQFEAWGATISWMVKTFVFDNNPDVAMDNNITIIYSGKQDVEATKENFRLPSNVVMNLSDDSTTGVTITWLTKYSITDSDIELKEYSENPVFTGKATKDGRVSASYTKQVLTYPGADLGIIGFLDYGKEYTQHVVKLTGLTPGTKYSYRVGSAAYGWWSDTGTITTSGGDEAFTFINISDAEAQCERHYQTYASVLSTALNLYPDARFTVSNGDQVGLGTTSKHWNYFFNSSDSFLSLPFMPTAGETEKKGEAIKTNFTLPNVPKQDETTGTYYSYDYNNVHFTVLNTNDLVDDKLSDTQLDWMKKDIKGSNARWKIVVLHNALYANSEDYKSDETVGLRNQLSALLPYLGVDLVLQGHGHVYTRTDVMKANCVMPTNTEKADYMGQTFTMKVDPRGTVYSAPGSAGVKEAQLAPADKCSKYFPAAECVTGNDYPIFSAITVDGDSLYYTAYQVADGSVKQVDSFGIRKSEGNTAPTDKVTSTFDNMIQSFLGRLNIKYTWKIGNILLKIFSPIIKIFQKIV